MSLFLPTRQIADGWVLGAYKANCGMSERVCAAVSTRQVYLLSAGRRAKSGCPEMLSLSANEDTWALNKCCDSATQTRHRNAHMQTYRNCEIIDSHAPSIHATRTGYGCLVIVMPRVLHLASNGHDHFGVQCVHFLTHSI